MKKKLTQPWWSAKAGLQKEGPACTGTLRQDWTGWRSRPVWPEQRQWEGHNAESPGRWQAAGAGTWGLVGQAKGLDSISTLGTPLWATRPHFSFWVALSRNFSYLYGLIFHWLFFFIKLFQRTKKKKSYLSCIDLSIYLKPIILLSNYHMGLLDLFRDQSDLLVSKQSLGILLSVL